MKGALLAIGGAVVLVAVVVLWQWGRSSPDDPGGHATPAPQTHDPGPIAQPTAPAPSASESPRPSLPDTTASSGDDGVKEYAVGDHVIRDHRSGDQAPRDVLPSIHPPEGRKIPSTLTAAMSQRVRAVINDCAAAVPAEARGAKPWVDGQIVIAIKNKQAQVTRATVQLRDIVGVAKDQAKQCIEQKAIGLANPAGDEADLADYPITISLAVR